MLNLTKDHNPERLVTSILINVGKSNCVWTLSQKVMGIQENYVKFVLI